MLISAECACCVRVYAAENKPCVPDGVLTILSCCTDKAPPQGLPGCCQVAVQTLEGSLHGQQQWAPSTVSHTHTHSLLRSHTNTYIQQACAMMKHDLYTNCLNRICDTFPAPCVLIIWLSYAQDFFFPAHSESVEGFLETMSWMDGRVLYFPLCQHEHGVCVRVRVRACAHLFIA